VANWKENHNFNLDLLPGEGSPLLDENGQQIMGSRIDVAEYQRGDFDGDGRRDCPPVPSFLANRAIRFK
jgi:hypothetical protein